MEQQLPVFRVFTKNQMSGYIDISASYFAIDDTGVLRLYDARKATAAAIVAAFASKQWRYVQKWCSDEI